MTLRLDTEGLDGLDRLDRQVLDVLRPCVANLLRKQEALVVTIHGRLLVGFPELASTPASGRWVCQRLIDVLLRATDPRQPEAAAAVRQVAADACREGFTGLSQGAVTHVLIHAVRANFTGEWSSALSSAWAAYLIWLRDQLEAGTTHEQRPVVQATPAPPAAQDVALDDEDADEPALGGLMVSMTLNNKRDRNR